MQAKQAQDQIKAAHHETQYHKKTNLTSRAATSGCCTCRMSETSVTSAAAATLRLLRTWPKVVALAVLLAMCTLQEIRGLSSAPMGARVTLPAAVLLVSAAAAAAAAVFAASCKEHNS